MDTPVSDEIAAMLKREGIDYQTMLRVPHEGNPRDLLPGRADAMVTCLPGLVAESLPERCPLSYCARVSSSEKAPRGKFEHRWFGEQPSQQERRQAGHSTSPMSQAGSEALSSTRTVAPKGNINLTFDDAVFPL